MKSRTWLSDFPLDFHFHALEKEMATHSSVLAWRIPGTGQPSRLPSMGSHRVGHNWSNLAAAAAGIYHLHSQHNQAFSILPNLLSDFSFLLCLHQYYLFMLEHFFSEFSQPPCLKCSKDFSVHHACADPASSFVINFPYFFAYIVLIHHTRLNSIYFAYSFYHW